MTSYELSRSLDPAAGEDPYLLLQIGRTLLIVEGKGEEELDRAAAALAESDPPSAAEAAVLRGEVIWQRGDQEGSFLYFERAAAAVEELPVSQQKLFVVSQVARFLTLAGRSAEGRDLAEQAIVMAEELDDKELLADALNTRGVARSAFGDVDSIDDLERSLELGLKINSWRAGRAYVNLGSTLANTFGEVVRAEALMREGLAFAERLGLRLSLRWFHGNLAEMTFERGLWDEALRFAEIELADPEPHYMSSTCRRVRAYVRLARGDLEGALADIEASVEQSRATRDPQDLFPTLADQAFVHAVTGDLAGAAATLDELAHARMANDEPDLSGTWIVTLAFALLELGRESELLAEEDSIDARTLWWNAALGIATGDLAGAADILQETGAVTFEAYARLRAAAKLAAEGRHAEAGGQLASSLSFYRARGATRYVREGEALLAAAS